MQSVVTVRSASMHTAFADTYLQILRTLQQRRMGNHGDFDDVFKCEIEDVAAYCKQSRIVQSIRNKTV